MNVPNSRRIVAAASALACTLAGLALPPQADAAGGRSNDRAVAVGARHVTQRTAAAEAQVVAQMAASPIIRVYQDEIPWFGSARDKASLTALGKVLGEDWFIHPIADCQSGIPADTAVVVFTSNSNGEFSQAEAQQHPACQAALADFVSAGGVLVVDMGDNLNGDGFIAPGAEGSPTLFFPPAETCGDLSLTAAAAGPDSQFGTADDHPLIAGPDRTPGTADDLNDTNIDIVTGQCSAAHGHLAAGITLPPDATALLTADFGEGPQPVHAEYCLGNGRVIVDTVTKEFEGHTPSGFGAPNYMTALFSYALSADAACAAPPPPAIAVSVDVKPGGCENPLNVNAKGVLPVAVAGSAGYDVSQIDLATVTLAGVPALRGAVADIATAGACAAGGDGIADLSLKFDNAAVGAAIAEADGSTAVLPLAGNLKAEFGGTAILGEDVVRVIRKK